MSSTDPRIDKYITKSPEFARPILTHLRKLVHENCPEVEETLKWGFPNFMYKGILCSMAAFKQHCSFGFWKGGWILKEKAGDIDPEGMGQFGKIVTKSDLPSDALLSSYIRKAVALKDEAEHQPPKSRPTPRKPLSPPSDLLAAIKRNAKAYQTFQAFSPSHRNEYIEWITEAKREDTRKKRIETAVVWMAQGKARNWKYAR